MSEKRLVTRSEALDRFINERVLGERGFSIQGNTCLYAGPHGGCEIGQYLPEHIASQADKQGWSLTTIATIMARDGEAVELEGLGWGELATGWWLALQRAHDNLAYYCEYGWQGTESDDYRRFQEALRELTFLEQDILAGKEREA